MVQIPPRGGDQPNSCNDMTYSIILFGPIITQIKVLNHMESTLSMERYRIDKRRANCTRGHLKSHEEGSKTIPFCVGS